MALPEGAHYVTGSVRKLVQLADGSIVRRQAAENLAVLASRIPGVTTDYQLRKLRKEYGSTETARAMRLSDRYRSDSERSRGLLSRGDRRGRSERGFDDLALALTKEHRERGAEIDKSPDGVLAHYLVATGRRNPGADYAVGETPSVMN